MFYKTISEKDSRKTFAKSLHSFAILCSRNDPLGKARSLMSSFRVDLLRTVCGAVCLCEDNMEQLAHFRQIFSFRHRACKDWSFLHVCGIWMFDEKLQAKLRLTDKRMMWTEFFLSTTYHGIESKYHKFKWIVQPLQHRTNIDKVLLHCQDDTRINYLSNCWLRGTDNLFFAKKIYSS